MDSIKSINSPLDEENIDRRSFLTKSICYTTAGLSLFAYPGILTEALAAEAAKSKEEIYGELEAKVEKFYPVYQTCSQATFASLNDQFGLQAEETVTAIKLFAGGIVGKGETCGAVTGALLAIGFNFEVKNEKGSDAGSSMTHGRTFFDRFEKEFGSIRCKEVMKHQYGKHIDFSSEEDRKILSKPENQGKCLEVMKKAGRIAADIILENS
ncbi:C-GCAxxG-C-C family protein [Thermodesulfobacteriota bacterium]